MQSNNDTCHRKHQHSFILSIIYLYTMEVAGLGIGVLGLVGLFSTCLDIVERWDTYKDFGTEAEFFRARLYADKVRFQQWGQQVGISEDRRESHHHKALNDSSIRPAIDLILRSIKNI